MKSFIDSEICIISKFQTHEIEMKTKAIKTFDHQTGLTKVG